MLKIVPSPDTSRKKEEKGKVTAIKELVNYICIEVMPMDAAAIQMKSEKR
jgi:hypothetical protein